MDLQQPRIDKMFIGFCRKMEPAMICRFTLAVLVSVAAPAAAGEVPVSIFGRAQVYDASTFDLMSPYLVKFDIASARHKA